MKSEATSKPLFENGLTQPGGTLEVGGNGCFEFIDDRKSPFHLRNYACLLCEGWYRDRKTTEVLYIHSTQRDSSCLAHKPVLA